MNTKSKIINLYLVDGKSTGIIKCSTKTTKEVIYKIPRSLLSDAQKLDEAKYSGIYLLIGTDEETEKKEVYIGQANQREDGTGIIRRLYGHTGEAKAESWNESLIIVTNDNTLSSTELNYLERKFTDIAVEADRYTVNNLVKPHVGNLLIEDKLWLDVFIDNVRNIIGSIGYDVFNPLIPVENDPNQLTLYIDRYTNKSGKVIKAKCRRTPEGFVVLKGSMIDTIDAESLIKNNKTVTQKRKDAEIEDGILKEDILFEKSSAAAMFVLGASASGRDEWKTIDGITLKEIEVKEKN